MADDRDDINFATTLGGEFRSVFIPVVGEEVSGHDFYSAIVDTLGQPVTAALLQGLSSTDLERLRKGFETYFECREIRKQDLLAAVERTLRISGY